MKLFDQSGALQETLPAIDIEPSGMFASDDIRMPVPGGAHRYASGAC